MTPEMSRKFERIDPIILTRRANDFARIDLDSLGWRELHDAVVHVITPPGEDSATIPTATHLYPIGTTFWRARSLRPVDRVLPLRSINKISDAWEAPSEIVTNPGRLNKVGESLLYTCVDTPASVADEIGIKDKEKFLLIKYRSTTQISLTGIGTPLNTSGLTRRAAKNANLISSFLSGEFLRKKSADNRTYKLSEALAKNFADLPPEFHHGWLYPSVATKGALNATFRAEDAHAKLELIGVAIATVSRSNTGIKYGGYCYTGCENENDDFVWYPQGSAFQRVAFPEFGGNSGPFA